MRTSQLTLRRVTAESVLCPLCRGQAMDFVELNIQRNLSGKKVVESTGGKANPEDGDVGMSGDGKQPNFFQKAQQREQAAAAAAARVKGKQTRTGSSPNEKQRVSGSPDSKKADTEEKKEEKSDDSAPLPPRCLRRVRAEWAKVQKNAARLKDEGFIISISGAGSSSTASTSASSSKTKASSPQTESQASSSAASSSRSLSKNRKNSGADDALAAELRYLTIKFLTANVDEESALGKELRRYSLPEMEFEVMFPDGYPMEPPKLRLVAPKVSSRKRNFRFLHRHFKFFTVLQSVDSEHNFNSTIEEADMITHYVPRHSSSPPTPQMSTGSFWVQPHGALCMELLTVSGWSPATSLEQLCQHVRAMMSNKTSGSIANDVVGAGVDFFLGKNTYSREEAWKTANRIEEIHAQSEWGGKGKS